VLLNFQNGCSGFYAITIIIPICLIILFSFVIFVLPATHIKVSLSRNLIRKYTVNVCMLPTPMQTLTTPTNCSGDLRSSINKSNGKMQSAVAGCRAA